MKFFSKDKISITNLNGNDIKEKKYTILLIDDEISNLIFLKGLLEKEYNVLTACNGEEAINLVLKMTDPEIISMIIADQRMPKMTGVEFLKRILTIIPDAIRIILTGFTDIDAIINAINDGNVYKYLTKPIDPNYLEITIKRALEAYELEKSNIKLLYELQELNASLEQKVAERTRQLQDTYDKLEKMSLTDSLTGLNNRHYFHKFVEKEVSLILTGNKTINFTFLLLDLDHFKNINDTYGHDAGDYILTETASVLKKNLPDCEIIRWGGEEFLVIIKYKKTQEIKEFAERIRLSIEEHSFNYGSYDIKQTLSIGFACFPFWQSHPSALSWKQVLQLADQALYSAKREGRNKWFGAVSTLNNPDFGIDLWEKIINSKENEYHKFESSF